MKKINKKYIQIATITLIVICISLLFNHYLENVTFSDNSKGNLGRIMLPILDGIALAYLLNPLMGNIEIKIVMPLFKKLNAKDTQSNKRRIRGISVTITLIIFLFIVAGLILLIFPQLLDSIQSIITRFPSYVNSFNLWSDRFLVQYPQLRQLLDNYWENITDYSIKEILPKIQSH